MDGECLRYLVSKTAENALLHEIRPFRVKCIGQSYYIADPNLRKTWVLPVISPNEGRQALVTFTWCARIGDIQFTLL